MTAAAMQRMSDVPVTIKCRLGIDEQTERNLFEFVGTVAGLSCVTDFVVHARQGLANLDTRSNRSIPELRYDAVHRLARAFPELKFTLNGGLTSIDMARAAAGWATEREGEPCDSTVRLPGVMFGRAASSNAFALLLPLLCPAAPGCELIAKRDDTLAAYTEYAALQLERHSKEYSVQPAALLRPLQSLYKGTSGAARVRLGINQTIERLQRLQRGGEASAKAVQTLRESMDNIRNAIDRTGLIR